MHRPSDLRGSTTTGYPGKQYREFENSETYRGLAHKNLYQMKRSSVLHGQRKICECFLCVVPIMNDRRNLRYSVWQKPHIDQLGYTEAFCIPNTTVQKKRSDFINPHAMHRVSTRSCTTHFPGI